MGWPDTSSEANLSVTICPPSKKADDRVGVAYNKERKALPIVCSYSELVHRMPSFVVIYKVLRVFQVFNVIPCVMAMIFSAHVQLGWALSGVRWVLFKD